MSLHVAPAGEHPRREHALALLIQVAQRFDVPIGPAGRPRRPAEPGHQEAPRAREGTLSGRR